MLRKLPLVLTSKSRLVEGDRLGRKRQVLDHSWLLKSNTIMWGVRPINPEKLGGK